MFWYKQNRPKVKLDMFRRKKDEIFFLTFLLPMAKSCQVHVN